MAEIWSKTLWIYGLAIVVSLLIAVVIKLIVVLLGRVERKPASAPAGVAVPLVPAPAFDVAADHLVVIAAAAYAMIGSHRIVHIDETRRRTGWLAEGRQAHHASHGVEHHPKH
jgi:Na+-transporting methylmalonyl-CoA/oxaloacetate decarboxylase gamma subunit